MEPKTQVDPDLWTEHQQEVADLQLELELSREEAQSYFDVLMEVRDHLAEALECLDEILDDSSDSDEYKPHPTQPMTTPQGEIVYIDTLMIPVIQALWDAGVETRYCCQGNLDHGGNDGYVAGPRTSSALKAQEVLRRFDRESTIDADDGTPTWAIRFEPFVDDQ